MKEPPKGCIYPNAETECDALLKGRTEDPNVCKNCDCYYGLRKD